MPGMAQNAAWHCSNIFTPSFGVHSMWESRCWEFISLGYNYGRYVAYPPADLPVKTQSQNAIIK